MYCRADGMGWNGSCSFSSCKCIKNRSCMHQLISEWFLYLSQRLWPSASCHSTNIWTVGVRRMLYLSVVKAHFLSPSRFVMLWWWKEVVDEVKKYWYVRWECIEHCIGASIKCVGNLQYQSTIITTSTTVSNYMTYALSCMSLPSWCWVILTLISLWISLYLVINWMIIFDVLLR